MKIDVSTEIRFKTARSGGKGGQDVNKVKPMVEDYFHIGSSSFFSAEQKEILIHKLSNKINADGYLLVKSQVHRSQLANKEEVVEKINQQLAAALKKQKKRIATKPSKSAVEKRIESKKKQSEMKR